MFYSLLRSEDNEKKENSLSPVMSSTKLISFVKTSDNNFISSM